MTLEKLHIQLPYPAIEGGLGWTQIWYRPDATDDEVVIREIWVEDVYRLRGWDKESWAERPVVDLGANIGALSLMCLRYGARVVVAVEPHPDNLTVLHANLDRYLEASVIEAAVADQPGHATLAGAQGEAHLTANIGQPVGQPVAAVALEQLLAGHRRVGLLKVDIEGGEFDAFAACPSEFLNRVDRLVMEWHGPGLSPHLDPDDGARAGRLFAKLAETHTLDIVGAPSRGGMLFATSYTKDE